MSQTLHIICCSVIAEGKKSSGSNNQFYIMHEYLVTLIIIYYIEGTQLLTIDDTQPHMFRGGLVHLSYRFYLNIFIIIEMVSRSCLFTGNLY